MAIKSRLYTILTFIRESPKAHNFERLVWSIWARAHAQPTNQAYNRGLSIFFRSVHRLKRCSRNGEYGHMTFDEMASIRRAQNFSRVASFTSTLHHGNITDLPLAVSVLSASPVAQALGFSRQRGWVAESSELSGHLKRIRMASTGMNSDAAHIDRWNVHTTNSFLARRIFPGSYIFMLQICSISNGCAQPMEMIQLRFWSVCSRTMKVGRKMALSKLTQF